MEKQTGYYIENYIEPEIIRNIQAGAKVVEAAVKPIIHSLVLLPETSNVLRSIALKR